MLCRSWLGAIVFLATCSSLCIAQPSFIDADHISAGDNALTRETSAIAAVDFDDDGDPDLVVANRSTDELILLVNDGDGNFAAGETIDTGRRPTSIAVDDYNGDGLDDLAVALLGDDQVAILLGNGDGFDLDDAYGVGDSPQHVTTGDVNGDSLPDLVTANEQDDTLSVLINAGDGTFFAAAQLDVAVQGGASRSEPNGSVVGDFDGDGLSDIAAALAFRDEVGILLGSGGGTFADMQLVEVGRDPTFVVAGLLDGDDNLDLVVANTTDDSLSILLGDGAGNFDAATIAGAGNHPESIALADLDGDGVLDIVTANREGDNVSVLLGDGDGGFDSPDRFSTGGAPTDVVALDLDGDNEPDIATANQEGGLVLRDDVSVLIAGEPVLPPMMPECGDNCGPLGMLPLAFTLLGLVGMKRRLRLRA